MEGQVVACEVDYNGNRRQEWWIDTRKTLFSHPAILRLVAKVGGLFFLLNFPSFTRALPWDPLLHSIAILSLRI